MIKKIHLLMLSAALILGMSACTPDNRRYPVPSNPQPQEYAFIEDFDNDANGWSFADPVNYAYGVVSDGTFKFDYNDDLYEAYYAAMFVGFNPYNDFTIESRIGSNNNMGILFGYDDQKGSYGYSFMIDVYGYYSLYDEGGNGYGGDIQELVSPTTGNFVNPNGDWNDLRIEQRGNRWYGYVNEVQVFDIQAQNMVGTGVGFVNVSLTQGEADYFDVHWFE